MSIFKNENTTFYEEHFGISMWEMPSFSFFRKPVRNTVPCQCISIPDIYRYIVGNYAKAQTEMLRSITDKAAARRYKAENFDFCTFSGIFHSRSRDGLAQQSDLLCIDFDHVADIPSLRERLLKEEHFDTELMFRSPSGDGLKWVIQVFREDMDHSSYFLAIYNYLRANGYPEPDRSGSDVSRACFIPYDPDAYINPKYDKIKDGNIFSSKEMAECPF